MKKITSKDGTQIAYQRSGAGTPLVLVHGTGATHVRWVPVMPVLEQHFDVYAIDRRSYGESGDAPGYTLEREFEDVAALVSLIGTSVNLLGHSFGAICSLEAALLTQNLRRLILYEPPISEKGASLYPAGMIERMQALLDAGDREGVLTIMFREVVRMPPGEFEIFRSSPAWTARLASAHILPRELRAQEMYRFRADRFKSLTTPTLLLQGGASPEFFKESIARVNAALPSSRVVVLPGQQHIAMDTAPELFLSEVVTFLTELEQTEGVGR